MTSGEPGSTIDWHWRWRWSSLTSSVQPAAEMPPLPRPSGKGGGPGATGVGGNRGGSAGTTGPGWSGAAGVDSSGGAGLESSGGAGLRDGGSEPTGGTGAPPSDASVVPGAMTTPERLRCELRDSPLGIQTATPRLSWELAAGGSARGLSQTAYEVLMATSPDMLAMGQGDLLATGIVASSEQRLVYGASRLDFGARVLEGSGS